MDRKKTRTHEELQIVSLRLFRPLLSFMSDWKKEFDAKWNYASFTWNGDNTTGVNCAKKTRNLIKSFIERLLTAQRKQILERIEDNLDLNKPAWGDLIDDLKTGDI